MKNEFHGLSATPSAADAARKELDRIAAKGGRKRQAAHQKRVRKRIAIILPLAFLALAILGGVMLHRAVQNARNDFVVAFYVPQEEQPDALIQQGNLSHLPVAGVETVKVSLEDVIAHPERYGAWKDTDGDGKPKPSRKEVIEQVWHLPGGGFKDMNGNGRIGYYDKAHQPLEMHVWDDKADAPVSAIN
jgi:hypothetical protein